MQVSPRADRFRSSNEPSRTSTSSTLVTTVTTFLGADTRRLCSSAGRPRGSASLDLVASFGITVLSNSPALDRDAASGCSRSASARSSLRKFDHPADACDNVVNANLKIEMVFLDRYSGLLGIFKG